MGYQEFMIKIKKHNMSDTIEKIKKNIEQANITEYIKLLDDKAVLQKNVNICRLGEREKSFAKLHKNDEFLILCGDRCFGTPALAGIRNAIYPIETILHSAKTSDYNDIFKDETLGKDV